jgi:hypothetical protein
MTPNAEEGAIMAERFPLIIHFGTGVLEWSRTTIRAGSLAEEGIEERQ